MTLKCQKARERGGVLLTTQKELHNENAQADLYLCRSWHTLALFGATSPNWWLHLLGNEECQCSSVPTGKRETSVMSHIGNDAS